MLLSQRCLLPTVKSDGLRLPTPRCMLTVGLRAIKHGKSREFGRFTRYNAIIVHCVIVVGVVHGHRVIHAWVEQVVKVAGLLIGREVRQK